MAPRLSTKDRQRQIAEATLQIVARDGLGKFTAAALAKEVGITDGTIFRHFDNMESVVDAAIAVLVEKLTETFPPEHSNPLERLGDFFKRRFHLITTEPAVLKLFFSDQLTQAAGKEGVDNIRRIQRESMVFIRRCLQEAKDSGLLRGGLQVEELSPIIHGSILGGLLRFVHADAPEEKSASQPGEHLWKTIATLITAERSA
jgi:AcrR family transcriptional regulator